jgi:hypothetical protein
VLPNPSDWPEWIVVLLCELETWAADNDDYPQDYELALKRLRDQIDDRLRGKNWPPVI